MNIYIYQYESFADFESVFLTTFMHGSANIISVSETGGLTIAESGLKMAADHKTADVLIEDIDLFVIPGGDFKKALSDIALPLLLKQLDKSNTDIIGICGGVFLLAQAGILKNRRCTGNSNGLDAQNEDVVQYFENTSIIDADIVTDGNVITATGQSFIELGCEVEMRWGGTTKKQMREDYKWWKNSNSPWEKKLYSE